MGNRKWTDAELDILRDRGATTYADELGEMLGRTLWAVRTKMNELRIRCLLPKRLAQTPKSPGIINDCMPNPFDNRCCRKQFDVKYYLRYEESPPHRCKKKPTKATAGRPVKVRHRSVYARTLLH